MYSRVVNKPILVERVPDRSSLCSSRPFNFPRGPHLTPFQLHFLSESTSRADTPKSSKTSLSASRSNESDGKVGLLVGKTDGTAEGFVDGIADGIAEGAGDDVAIAAKTFLMKEENESLNLLYYLITRDHGLKKCYAHLWNDLQLF